MISKSDPALCIMALMNRYATAGRYPGDWEMPTREEAAAALEMARKARDAVRKCLPAESLA